MSSFIIFPSGNTFSHLQECQIIGEELHKCGHKVLYGISKYYSDWAQQQGLDYEVVAELWEKGPTDHPNISWFIDHEYVIKCVQDEVDLIRNFAPDYILANFKYTTGLSARITNTPLITINIFSMLPETKANFGYLRNDTQSDSLKQQKHLMFFDNFGCKALNYAAKQFGLKPFTEMTEFLDGEWVFVPDSTWFQILDKLPKHYLPIHLLNRERIAPSNQAINIWKPFDSIQLGKISIRKLIETETIEHDILAQKTVFLTLGSSCRSSTALIHIVSALNLGPWKLHVSLSGTNKHLYEQMKALFPETRIDSFYNLNITAHHHMDLIVCQGGLGTIYKAIEIAVPLLVVPQQPEQDHNGLLVETHKLGKRLWPSHVFEGKEDKYIQKLLETPLKVIAKIVRTILLDDNMQSNLIKAREILTTEQSLLPNIEETLQTIFTQDILKAKAALPKARCRI